MLEEIWNLGFRQIELGHGIRVSLLQGIADFVRDHDLTITSVHNFCPLPIDVFHSSPDCLQCTSNDGTERKRAERHTLATIDQAASVGAPTVVLHLGFARMRNFTKELVKQIYDGKIFSRTFVRTKLRALRLREQTDLYSRVLDWLRPVVEHATQAGVALAIENRIEIETFPNESEFQRLFQDLDQKVVGYWHDFGHAQVRQHLTLLDHAEWLKAAAPRLLGCHVHDVIYPDRDHRIPFQGIIPFKELLDLIPKQVPLVWELTPRVSADEILMALKRWRELFPHELGVARSAA